MEKQRTGGTVKFRTAAIWGIGVLAAMVLWGVGCGRTSSEYGQFPPNAEGLTLVGMRPPAGDSTRLLRNAHYLKLMGRPEMALKELEAAYQQDPGNIRVMNALALACDEMGEFKRAQKLYQEALALDVSNQALNNNLCFSYYLAGQWDQAEACFRQALNRNPQNIMARNNLGLLLCRRGRTEEARRLWQETEGEALAQKKMQQVMVALGGGETSHYAQLPPSAPVAAAPLPERPLPRPAVTQDTPAAKMALPSPPASPPQAPVAPPAKAREPVKVAALPAPVAPPAKETPAPATMAAPVSPAPAPPQKPAPVVKTQGEPAAAKPVAKPVPAVDKTKPAPQVAAAAPAQVKSPPAPPKQAAKDDIKPTPASTPAPQPKPGKIKLGAASAPVKLSADELAQGRIEVLNGTGDFDLARQARSQLKEAGFKVVGIGNYRNFGDKNTLIYYRPGAEEVARALSAKYPKSRIEAGEKMYQGANIRIVLGKDAVTPAAVASEPAAAAEKIAAGIGSGHPEAKPAAPAAASVPAPAAAQAKAPVAASPSISPVLATQHPYLTASELEEMGIDIRNGTPAPDLARKARSMLSQEGFNVVHIGNHIDFGAEKTIISYRPGAEKMARNLSAKFFPNSTVEQTAKLPENVAVKVLLGRDLLQRTDVMAKLDN